jgi:hypothetical protein
VVAVLSMRCVESSSLLSGSKDRLWNYVRAMTCRVAAWIGAAYWSTASTSIANPAITIDRALSNTFAGIAPNNAPGFIASQLRGALIGLVLAKWLQIGSTATDRASESQIKV